MGRKVAVLLLLFSVLIFIITLVFAIIFTQSVPHEQVAARVIVDYDKSGFDLSGNDLNFGAISPGTTSSRTLTITNPYEFEVTLTLEFIGDIQGLIVYESSSTLAPHETKQIGFTAQADQTHEEGLYEGTLQVYLK